MNVLKGMRAEVMFNLFCLSSSGVAMRFIAGRFAIQFHDFMNILIICQDNDCFQIYRVLVPSFHGKLDS